MRRSLSLLTALALTVAPFAASAESLNEITNLQLNDADIFSELNVEVDDIDGKLEATSAAIANSFSAELGGSSVVNVAQDAAGNVNSRLDVTASEFNKAVDLTSAAIANSASVTVEGGQYADIDVLQERGLHNDPFAKLDFQGDGVGDVTATAAAISNSLSVSTLPSTVNTNVHVEQSNYAKITAIGNLALDDTGAVSATAAAIGNSVSISNLLND